MPKALVLRFDPNRPRSVRREQGAQPTDQPTEMQALIRQIMVAAAIKPHQHLYRGNHRGG
jgi:hypothetical protein